MTQLNNSYRMTEQQIINEDRTPMSLEQGKSNDMQEYGQSIVDCYFNQAEGLV